MPHLFVKKYQAKMLDKAITKSGLGYAQIHQLTGIEEPNLRSYRSAVTFMNDKTALNFALKTGIRYATIRFVPVEVFNKAYEEHKQMLHINNN